MPLLKKLITAVVLLLLLAMPLLFSVTLLVKQKITQYQRNEKFGEHTLETISIASVDIYWVKTGKEILYKGKLFDVKSFTVSDSSILLTGFFDDEEDKLVEQIAELVQQKDQSENPLAQPAIKFLFFPVYYGLNEFTIDAGNWQWVLQQYRPFFEIIPDIYIHPPIHPPC